MGNALVGTVSQAIHPIDHYLADVPEFQYQSSLGSTRFLKVAKCGHYEGDCVVKVLAVDDPSLPLAAHKQRIEHLSTLTARNVSVAAFHRAVICPSFAYIARQYVRYSLYDRLSTRPFLTAGEKSWLAYQLVKCLDWLHGHGIRHGDIKLENILITSSLWLVITDLATYKPVLLPDDNPSDFSYFFDTSRRRCCNIAPERFVSDSSGLQSATADYTMTGPIGSAAAAAAGANSQLLLTPSSPQPPKEPQLTPEMDMFSIGCVLAELFSDDAPNGNLFDLAELLAFRVDQYYPTKALDSISNETIRELVKNLISLQPTERKLSGQILAELSGSLFPGYMSTLYDYLQQLVRLPPDAKVIRLSRDLDQLLSLILSQEPHGLLLVLVVITSTMRALKHIHCKLLAQRLACKIAAASPIMSAYITDRLLPYLLHSLTDSDPRVRAEAVYSITISLEQVDDLPASDNNVFTDYILPVLCQVVSDQSAFVRLTLAANISRLSKVSLNFLSQSCDQNYDEELTLLHNSFQLIVTQLLTDGNNCVRRTLLLTPYSCANLCVFFGRQKTNDLILSHIITFLNDKNDFQLRASFFDNIIVIASYLGSDQCSKILQPLLQQGLSDAEEIIIYKIITSMTSLIEQGLLKKSIIYELLREAVPLLSHPNLWINQSMISLILTLCSRLSLADISCKIKPLVDPNLQRQIHSLKNGRLLKDSLYPLLPRSVYDLIVGQSKLNIDRFFECLIQRKYLRQVVRHHQQSVIVLEDALYTRLTHEGINEQIEDQLVSLADLIKKIYRNKKNLSTKKVSGMIAITTTTTGDRQKNRKYFSVVIGDRNRNNNTNNNNNNNNGRQHQPSSSSSHRRQASAMNEEWLHMFGSKVQLVSSNGDNTISGVDDDIDGSIPVAQEARESGGGVGGGGSEQQHVQCPPCQLEIKRLIQYKKSNFNPLTTTTTTSATTVRWTDGQPFKPKGVLVAHLHEHEKAVKRVLRVGNNSSLFATCSADGTVRVWDASKMEGKSVINRSRLNFVAQSKLNPQSMGGMTYCGDCLIVYTNTNHVHILEINQSPTARMKLLNSFQVIPDIDGSVITDITTLGANTFAMSLSDSSILIYDLRTLVTSTATTAAANEIKPVHKLNIAAHERVITAIDGNDCVMFCGTYSGLLITFDLRFLLRSNTSAYMTQNRVRRIKYTDDGLYSSAQGNCEVTLWDCETGSRLKTLWASTAPALSVTQASPHSVLGMIVSKVGNDSSIITSGTDMRIRYWDLQQPERSYIISDNAKSQNNGVSYTSKFIEGIQVIQECQDDNNGGVGGGGGLHQPPVSSPSTSSSSASSVVTTTGGAGVGGTHYYQQHHHSTWDHQAVSPSHRDCITDIARVNHLLVSASSDGVVKVWK